MSQITLPWVQRDRERLSTYRQRAIRALLVLGVLLVVMALGVYRIFALGDAEKIVDWRVPIALLFMGSGLAGLALILGGLVVATFRALGRILRMRYVPITLLVTGIIAVCLIVWLHASVFRLVETMRDSATVNGYLSTELGLGVTAELTAKEIYRGLEDLGAGVPLLAYGLWPLQFVLVRDLIALGGIVGFLSIVPVFGIWWERKVAGRIQSRLGPMRVGGWHGWLQSPADGIKLIFKEDLVPPEGDTVLFRLAPYLAFVPAVCLFIALPFAGTYVFRDLDVALLFILAMLGIEVVGVIVAGWASNNKWSVYGAMREACQMVSYEIPLGMSLLIPVMTVGTLQLTEIADAQAGGWHHWLVFENPWCFFAFFSYYVASLASCKRAPFDLPESESELVAGFHTEYSGFRWSLFFFAEYVAMFAVSGVAVILFLGGWKSPFPASWAPHWSGNWVASFAAAVVRGIFFEGPILFILKAAFLYYVQLWIRWTLPRIRIDQVLYGCVQVLLPMTMVMLLANTLWILGIRHLEWGWLIGLDTVLHWALVIIGYAIVLGMLGISTYGYRNRTRLPGPLVVRHLPGA